MALLLTECSGLRTTLHGAEGRKTKTPTGQITHGRVSLLRPLQRLRLSNGRLGLGLRHRHLGLRCCGASLGLRCRGASLGLQYCCTSFRVPSRRIRLGKRCCRRSLGQRRGGACRLRLRLRSGDPRIRKGLALPSGGVSAARSLWASAASASASARATRASARASLCRQVQSAPLALQGQTNVALSNKQKCQAGSREDVSGGVSAALQGQTNMALSSKQKWFSDSEL